MTEFLGATVIIAGLMAGALIGLRHVYAVGEAATRRTIRVTYPRGARPEQALAFARSLSGLLPPRCQRLIASPAVVVETRADAAGIAHYLRLPAAATEYVLSQLRASLPGVRIEEESGPDPLLPSLALELRATSTTQALRTDDPAHSAAALLATLQPLRDGEQAVVQWIVTPEPPAAVPEIVTLTDPRRGWAALLTGRAPEPIRLPAELVRSERDKRSEPRFSAVARLGVRCTSSAQRALGRARCSSI